MSTLSNQWQLKFLLMLAMTMPMIVLYSVSSLGTQIVEALNLLPGSLGYLVTSSFSVASILSIGTGWYVSRYGARHSLLLLFTIVVIAFLLIAFQPSYYSLMIAAGLCGVSQALANPSTNVLIRQNFSLNKQASVVGLKQSGVQLAALISGVLLPVMALNYGWNWAYFSLIPLAILCIFLVITKISETKKSLQFTLDKPNRFLSKLMAIQLFVGIGLSSFVTFLPSFSVFSGFSETLSFYLIAVFGVVGMASRIVLTPVGARFNNEVVFLMILIGLSFFSVVLMVVFSANYFWLFWVSVVGVGATAVTSNSVVMSMIVRDHSYGKLSSASGYISVAFFGGFAIGPAVFGSLLNFYQDYTASWLIVCVSFLMAISVCVYLIVLRNNQFLAYQQSSEGKHKVMSSS